jgi:hypothetical protein
VATVLVGATKANAPAASPIIEHRSVSRAHTVVPADDLQHNIGGLVVAMGVVDRSAAGIFCALLSAFYYYFLVFS